MQQEPLNDKTIHAVNSTSLGVTASSRHDPNWFWYQLPWQDSRLASLTTPFEDLFCWICFCTTHFLSCQGGSPLASESEDSNPRQTNCGMHAMDDAFMPVLIHFEKKDTKYQRQIQFNAVLSITKQWRQSKTRFHQLKGHQHVTVTSHWHAWRRLYVKSTLVLKSSQVLLYFCTWKMHTWDTFAQWFLKIMAGWETRCPMQCMTIANISKFKKVIAKVSKWEKIPLLSNFHVLQQLSVQVPHAMIFCAKHTRKMSFFQYKNIQQDSNLAWFPLSSLYRKWCGITEIADCISKHYNKNMYFLSSSSKNIKVTWLFFWVQWITTLF